MTATLRDLFRCLSAALLLGVLPLLSAGCAVNDAPDLKITSINQDKCYQQGFTQAWLGRNSNGDYDIVLVDRATEQAMAGAPTSDSVRQVMHIRLLWSATRDMKAVVSNAAVKWYVIGKSNPRDVLEYQGIAFVYMEENDGKAKLKIKNAVLNPSSHHGNLTDPVGQSRLEGTFVARQDQQSVDKVLSGLKTALAATQAPGRAAGLMPTGRAE